MGTSKLVVSWRAWMGNFHVVEAVEAVEAVETLVGGGQCPILIADTDHLTKPMSLLINRANIPNTNSRSARNGHPFMLKPVVMRSPLLVQCGFFKSSGGCGAEMFFASGRKAVHG